LVSGDWLMDGGQTKPMIVLTIKGSRGGGGKSWGASLKVNRPRETPTRNTLSKVHTDHFWGSRKPTTKNPQRVSDH